MNDRNAVQRILLYDGVCGLCDKTVQFLLDIDKKGMLTFATLQGETGNAAILKYFQKEISGDYDSIMYLRKSPDGSEDMYMRSDAVMQIFRDLGGGWELLSWLRIIPRFIRDFVYDIIAKNRYNWFGKFDQCRLPTPEERARFLP